MFCTRCGISNDDAAQVCSSCQSALTPVGPDVIVRASDPLGGLIPGRNVAALVGYYLGVFSAIPVLGAPLGVAAIVLGIAGLKKVNAHPEVRGRVHAWVAIVLGSVFLATSVAAVVWMSHGGLSGRP